MACSPVRDQQKNLSTNTSNPSPGDFEPQKRAHSSQLAAGLASESGNSKLPYGRRFPEVSCGELQSAGDAQPNTSALDVSQINDV